MSKKILIPIAKTSAENPPQDKTYRFTAVLPEPVGQKLRVYCALKHLKIKYVLAEAVSQFIEKEAGE